jgi:ATP-binding cassette, subfamily F, member 3
MSVLLQCHRLSHSAGTKTLFSNIDLTINTRDRIGLVGHNGCGKSTLLSLLNGSQVADDGEMSRSNQLILETVEQFVDESLLDSTLFGALISKLPVEQQVVEKYRAEKLLIQLGFEPGEFSYLVADLSGGQQNRLMFARAVINQPNLILFDEPTNHLDLKTLLYFERFLGALDAAYLLISHDRQFLDAVTTRTVFLRDQRVYNFSMPYSAARQQLVQDDIAAEASRKVEEKKIDELRASAKRLALWGKIYDNKKLARKAKTMERRVDKLEDNKTFVTRGSGLSLSLDVARAKAKQMLRLENCVIYPPGRESSAPSEEPQQGLFHIDELLIRPGERVALLGHNGVGKSTLIRFAIAEYTDNRELSVVRFNPQCKIGYYDQELELLNPQRGLTETLRDNCPGSENEYKTALIRAGFPYRDLDKKVALLSGGEKARLMFLIIKLNQPNFLILDEPTNHIDIEGKEELEQQILDSEATVLITSHDRRFVDIIADRYLWIHDGELTEINDPETFYSADLAEPDPIACDDSLGIEVVETDEEKILQRIVELETLLQADMQRKTRFQKPKLQAAWQEELRLLNQKL